VSGCRRVSLLGSTVLSRVSESHIVRFRTLIHYGGFIAALV
jgi:hypothetical protein